MKQLHVLWTGMPQTFDWLIHITFFLLVGILAYFSKKRIVSKLLKKNKKSPLHLKHALLEASNGPMSWGISLAIIYLYIKTLNPTLEVSSIAYTIKLIGIFLMAWVFYRLIQTYEKSLLIATETKQGDIYHIDIISKLLRIIFFIVIGLITLQFLDISVIGLITLGSVSTLVVGFAGKEILANFFGGLMIYLDRPFKVGDMISSPDRQIEGTVEHIGPRLTHIRTRDTCSLYLPNAAFSSIALINISRMSNRRIKQNINIHYCDATKIVGLIDDIRAMLSGHPEIDQHRCKMVHLIEIGRPSLTLQIYAFTKTTSGEIFRDVQHDLFLKIIDTIHKHGADLAFPTQTLHIQ